MTESQVKALSEMADAMQGLSLKERKKLLTKTMSKREEFINEKGIRVVSFGGILNFEQSTEPYVLSEEDLRAIEEAEKYKGPSFALDDILSDIIASEEQEKQNQLLEAAMASTKVMNSRPR